MKKILYRMIWIMTAFIGGLSVVGTVSAVLKHTRRKYIEI